MMMMQIMIAFRWICSTFLKEDVNARSRPTPTAFVMDITNHLCDLIDDKHFTSANVNLCFQVADSSKSKAQGKPPTTSNRTTSKSNHPRVDLHLSWVAESLIVLLLQLLL